MLQTVTDLRKWSEPSLHLATSREDVNIRDALWNEFGALDGKMLSMSHISAGYNIAAFITLQLRGNQTS